MNCDIHLTDKLAIYRREVARMGIEVVAPCVNRSDARFTVQEGRIVYGLGALKGVGEDAMGLIVAARGDQPFRDLHDFARRVDMKRIGKRPLETLARAGAFDALDRNRARVVAALDALCAWSAAVQAQAASQQSSLFGGGEDLPPPRPARADAWLPAEMLAQEHGAVGFYLSGHPIDDWLPMLRRKNVVTLAELTAAAADGPQVAFIAGTVSSRQEKKSARGTRYAFVHMSDPTGLYEVTMFSDLLDSAREHLEAGSCIVLQVQVEASGDQLKLLARSVQPLEMVVADAEAGSLAVRLADASAAGDVANMLARIAAEVRAGPKARGPVLVRLRCGADEIDIEVAQDAPLTPPARQMLRAVPGVMEVIEV